MILSKAKVHSANLEKEISSKINAGKLNELLLIVPTNRKIRSLRREIISSAPNNAVGKINIETIGSFAINLLSSGGSASSRVLSDASSTVLLKQCFREVALKYFSNYEKDFPFGTLQRIKNVIAEYKRRGVSPGLLLREAENLNGSEKFKAEDIAAVFELYNSKCIQLGVKEIGDVYHEIISFASGNFDKQFRTLYPDVDIIIVNGFDEFTRPEIEIINSSADVKNISLFISFDYFSGNPAIFSHLDSCYNKFVDKGFKEIADDSTETYNEFQSYIREGLFNTPPGEKSFNFESSITKISAFTRENEIELIAKEIKEIIVNQKVEPHKICVTFNLIQKYSPLIRYYFPLYGLPFNLTDRYPLNTSAPVISIINFLEILENDFYYKNIFRALSSGYLTFSNIDSFSLLKASVNLKIISGYNNWQNSLRDAIYTSSLEEDDNENHFDFNRNLYEKALKSFIALNKILAPFFNEMSIQEFLAKLNEFIFTQNFISNLINDREENIELNAKALSTFIDEITGLFNLLELENGSEKKFPLKFFLNNIRTVISASRYNIKEKPNYGIQVTTLNEIRGLKFDYLFIGGMCDGDFPTRYSPEIFFSGSFAKNERVHQIEDRYHFYQSLCSWSKQLFLTAPLHEEKTEFVESNFLSEFISLFKVKLKSGKDYEKNIYTKEELLIYAGKNIAAGFTEELNFTGLNIDEIKKLIEINNLRIENPFGDSSYTGILSGSLSEEAVARLNEFKDRKYSVTQLETYALCPFKYFAERILKLEPLEEPTEEFEALELGSLIHEILFEFYQKLSEEKVILQKASDENYKFAYDLLFKIAEEKISRANFKSPLSFYEKERITGINGKKQNSILFKFLQAERDDPDSFLPAFFEISFGDKLNKKDGKDFDVEGIKLTGKIDRIDIDETNKKYRVVDYKLSGKKPSLKDLKTGISLQLPLYLFAAQKLIDEKINQKLVPADAYIYSLKPTINDFGLKTVIKEEMNSELIKICIDSIKNYVENIVNGKFNLSMLPDRETKVCGFCGFRSVCRIQEVS
ncbi:MAG: PD-(D/E)XK nuclease family protein [Ignavibacteriaceae bacterium]